MIANWLRPEGITLTFSQFMAEKMQFSALLIAGGSPANHLCSIKIKRNEKITSSPDPHGCVIQL